MADLAGFRDEVLSRIGLPDDDGMAQPADLNRAINAALAEYAIEGDWPWLQAETTITTVAGTATAALPTDFVRAVSARIGDEEVAYRAPGQVIYLANDRDQPRYYTGGIGVIQWVPTPDSTYDIVLRYVQAEPVLVADGDEPLLPANYHDYITVKAARKMAERLKDPQLLGILRASEQEWYMKLKGDQRRTTSLGRIRSFFRGV